MFPHPAKHWLDAFADDRLVWWRQPVVAVHLRNCERCRLRVHRAWTDAQAVSALLSLTTEEVDVEEALGRVLVRAGGPIGRPPPSPWSHWIWATAGVIATVLLVSRASANSNDRWSQDLHWLMDPDTVGGKSPRMDDRQFVGRLFELERSGKVRVIEDKCCDDRDGEGPADDGLLVLALAKEDAGLAVLYEDLDRSSTLTPGDVIRLVSRTHNSDISLNVR